jgi:hypothetical protein
VAPEQVEGRPVDQRSNLYSLGALYYFALTGQTVFRGTPEEVHKLHQSGQITPPSRLVPVGQPIENVIMRALDRSPTKRFLTVRQFVDEVTRVGHGEVIELKQTVAMGKAGGRPKAELVQTLLGVARGADGYGLPSIASEMANAAMPVATMQSGPPTVQSGPPQMPSPGIAASLASPPIAMTPLTPPDGQRSPWAPPGGQAAPVVGAPVVAPPVVAAPVVAAPVVAAPQVANEPAGKKKGGGGGEDSKGKFRETMWFKKGDLDAQAAVAAAEERARTGKDAGKDKADSKPIDERYKDDGSITRGDKEKYSLRTGDTAMMPSLKHQQGASQSLAKVSEDDLIGEMKGLPIWIKIAIPVGVIALVIVIIAIVTR